MPITDPSKKFRKLVFTLHQNLDYQKISGPDLLTRISSLTYFKYVIFSLESTTSGNPHYQGYVQFNTQKRISEIRTDFLNANFDYPNGSHEDNVKYCTKQFSEKDEDGNFTKGRSVKFPDLDCGPGTVGTPVITNKKGGRPKKSNDSDREIVELISRKTSTADIIRKNPESYRYIRQINETRRIIDPAPELDKPPLIYGFSGISGSGKTTYASGYIYEYKKHDPAKVYRANAATKTNPASGFEESAANANVLFLEEVRLGYPETYDFINIMSGKAPLSVKGSLIRNRFEFIYITAIDGPEDTYRGLSLYKDRYQIMRRIDYGFSIHKNRKLLQKIQGESPYRKFSESEGGNIYRPLVLDYTYSYKENCSNFEKKYSPPELEIAKKEADFRNSNLSLIEKSILKDDICDGYYSHERLDEKEKLILSRHVFNAEKTESLRKKRLELAEKKKLENSQNRPQQSNSGPDAPRPDDFVDDIEEYGIFPSFSLSGIIPNSPRKGEDFWGNKPKKQYSENKFPLITFPSIPLSLRILNHLKSFSCFYDIFCEQCEQTKITPVERDYDGLCPSCSFEASASDDFDFEGLDDGE